MFCVIYLFEIAIYELSIFRCIFLAIELPHVLELDFSSIKDRFIVLQCGLSGTIVFSN